MNAAFSVSPDGTALLDGVLSELWFPSDSDEWRLYCFVHLQPFAWVVAHRRGQPWRYLGQFSSGQQSVFDDGVVACRIGLKPNADLWHFHLPDGRVLKASRAGASGVAGRTLAEAKWFFVNDRKNPPEPIRFL